MALPALVAPRAMLAEAGTATRLTLVAPRAVLAEAGAAAFPALVAPLAVLADAAAAAIPAQISPLVVWALLVEVLPGWARRLGLAAVLGARVLQQRSS